MSIDQSVSDVQSLMQRKRVEGLMEAVYYCYGSAVVGDIAEFGTMTGATAYGIGVAMLAVERQYGLPAKNLDLYDSFVGLPEPDRTPDTGSPHVTLGHWAAGGCQGISVTELDAMMREALPEDRYRIVEGWYSDTVPSLPGDKRYAMLHVDCDLYGSTMDCMVPLFEKGLISRGCAVCFDDWMCNQADPAFGERKAFAELAERFDIRCSDWGAYTWSGARFIIHDYNGCPK
ncbi:MAG: TylF/MycF family methyltransferase [Alphaproteobacteria bacterium]|nr:TylF/MycF family methyltransferase [Alphaproteobacteria bacterium]